MFKDCWQRMLKLITVVAFNGRGKIKPEARCLLYRIKIRHKIRDMQRCRTLINQRRSLGNLLLISCVVWVLVFVVPLQNKT